MSLYSSTRMTTAAASPALPSLICADATRNKDNQKNATPTSIRASGSMANSAAAASPKNPSLLQLMHPFDISSSQRALECHNTDNNDFDNDEDHQYGITSEKISPQGQLFPIQQQQQRRRRLQPLSFFENTRKCFSDSCHCPPHLYVLPVLLMEFLALALTRAVLPLLLLEEFGEQIYLVMGCAECARGLLAFVACPAFGKWSDRVGRKLCLFITVAGTCAPVCFLAIFYHSNYSSSSSTTTAASIITNINETSSSSSSITTTTTMHSSNNESPLQQEEQQEWYYSFFPDDQQQQQAGQQQQLVIRIFVVLLALSGIFSSTFTLVFSYISDTVRQRDRRVSAYGLALATFGLSFTIGPMAGGYIARTKHHDDNDHDHDAAATESTVSMHAEKVFVWSFFLTLLNLLYIYAVLPESKNTTTPTNNNNNNNNISSHHSSTGSLPPPPPPTQQQGWFYSPWNTLRVISGDPFLAKVGLVAMLYYTALWAVISTLTLYAAKHFSLGPDRLGELMSAFGMCTMISEAILVRVLVPTFGEHACIRMGLVAFGLQCVVLAFAYRGWHLYVCVAFSLLGNLVYPSLSSLISASVAPHMVGEALGAMNGIKALTEGIGPLVFGTLMTLSEDFVILPGCPYLLAAVLVWMAHRVVSRELPTEQDEDYISERYEHLGKNKNQTPVVAQLLMNLLRRAFYSFVLLFMDDDDNDDDDDVKNRMNTNNKALANSSGNRDRSPSLDQELIGLLSEVEEDDDDED